ncbi:MAG: SDR family NAD(P)-dependent oxidoreductase, partial [Candidatus Lokiarchaeota archaeon]|nr:SDR family NAD(P)-dependent oxidoreductase [Candidatus Lokiarchaeota archaeon]MBD3338796.1 SDR family NAD(P)-dependent oxidoreductase [Candidatus Lokiarchaeota archaeon]
MGRKKDNELFDGKIAVVSGGSKGIGKAIAKEISKLGGSVCVIARGLEGLKTTEEEIKELLDKEDQFVDIISCDTSDMDELKPPLLKFVQKRGVPDYLINVVGDNHPDYLENLKLEHFKKILNANYYTQLVPTLILLPHFMEEKSGHIIFVSSVAAYIGLIGNATYTPSKAAVVGLAEVMRNELLPYNVKVSVLYPPDTDTPLLRRGNEVRPQEQAIISEKGGLMTPEEVARSLVAGIRKDRFEIFPGKAGFLKKIYRLFPRIVRSTLDKDYLKAREELG